LAFNNFLLNNTIRKALSYAINYSHITDVMMEGTSIRLKSPIPSGILYSNTTFNYPIFNITKARIIMQSTGHGTTLDPNYPGLNETDWDGLADRGINNFSMWVLDIDQFRSDLFNLCSKTFRKIGINLYKKETDGITFNNMMEQDPNWVDMWTTGFVADYNDPSNFINFMFSNISIGNLKHFGQVNDSYLQNLINLGTEEFDPVLRKGIYDEIQRYLVEELMPSAWLYIDKMYHVHGNYLTGFSQNVMEKTYFYYCTWLPHTYKVSIESSRDYISFLKGSTGKNITWTIAAENVENPTYNIFIDDVLNETRIWQNNDSIIIKLNNLPIGIHELKIEVINAPLKPYAYTVEDVVIVNIYTNEIPFPLEMVIIIVVLIVITMIIAGMVVTKRRSSRRRVILDEGKVVVSIPEEKSEEVEIVEEAVEEIVEEKPEEVEIIEEAVEEIVEE
ncbi:MAG: ABC transporter substrate-binding protein, partial [Promethearchaeota archaeon]